MCKYIIISSLHQFNSTHFLYILISFQLHKFDRNNIIYWCGEACLPQLPDSASCPARQKLETKNSWSFSANFVPPLLNCTSLTTVHRCHSQAKYAASPFQKPPALG